MERVKTLIRNARTQTSGVDMEDLLWFGFDFGSGRTSTSSAYNTLHLAVITVVAYFVWRPTRLEERLED